MKSKDVEECASSRQQRVVHWGITPVWYPLHLVLKDSRRLKMNTLNRCFCEMYFVVLIKSIFLNNLVDGSFLQLKLIQYLNMQEWVDHAIRCIDKTWREQPRDIYKTNEAIPQTIFKKLTHSLVECTVFEF